MKYYVKSAGTSPDYDYRWIYLNPKPRVNKVIDKNDPDFVKNFFIKKDIDPDSCVIALIRNNDKHLCLLAKFKTKYTDYQRRIIYNYLAMESENTLDNDVIKILANTLLKDNENIIIDKINKFIKPTNKGCGFQVDRLFLINMVNALYEYFARHRPIKYERLKLGRLYRRSNRMQLKYIIFANIYCIPKFMHYANECQRSKYKSITNINSSKIAKNSNDKRNEIANDIMVNISNNQGILILISDSMSIKSFNQIEGLAWGLSGSIEEDYWVDIPNNPIHKNQDILSPGGNVNNLNNPEHGDDLTDKSFTNKSKTTGLKKTDKPKDNSPNNSNNNFLSVMKNIVIRGRQNKIFSVKT